MVNGQEAMGTRQWAKVHHKFAAGRVMARAAVRALGPVLAPLLGRQSRGHGAGLRLG